jgi:hypothetical protein
MGPSFASNVRMGGKIELVRPVANARLERAFNYVSAHVISARVQLGLQQSLGVLKVKLGQLLEFTSVHTLGAPQIWQY